MNKGVRQECILSPFMFIFYSEHIMRTVGLEDTGIRVKFVGRVNSNLRYAGDNMIVTRRRFEWFGITSDCKWNSRLRTKSVKIENNDSRENPNF